MSNPAGKWSPADDEVDQLLRAAHDDVLLNLSLNSHIARPSASTSSIDPDLDRRFQALRRNPTNKLPPSISPLPQPPAPSEDDDLFARFAALKNSLPSHNKTGNLNSEVVLSNQEVKDEEEDVNEEDEVAKVIQWAIDAARLDPSPPSDDDDDDDQLHHHTDTDTDTDTDDGKKKKKKKVTKK